MSWQAAHSLTAQVSALTNGSHPLCFCFCWFYNTLYWYPLWPACAYTILCAILESTLLCFCWFYSTLLLLLLQYFVQYCHPLSSLLVVLLQYFVQYWYPLFPACAGYTFLLLLVLLVLCAIIYSGRSCNTFELPFTLSLSNTSSMLLTVTYTLCFVLSIYARAVSAVLCCHKLCSAVLRLLAI